jgi:hypothetical protein
VTAEPVVEVATFPAEKLLGCCEVCDVTTHALGFGGVLLGDLQQSRTFTAASPARLLSGLAL